MSISRLYRSRTLGPRMRDDIALINNESRSNLPVSYRLGILRLLGYCFIRVTEPTATPLTLGRSYRVGVGPPTA